MISCGARALWRRAHAVSNGWLSRAAVYGSLLAFVIVGFGAGWSVHTEPGYAREDWRALAAMLRQQPLPLPEIWLSDSESLASLQYYYRSELPILNSIAPPVCTTECWYVSRPSYPVGHSLYRQGATEPPVLPDHPACSAQLHWTSPTGLVVWRVKCS
jgi:hypothetical protein